jgi:hypothetical protein
MNTFTAVEILKSPEARIHTRSASYVSPTTMQYYTVHHDIYLLITLLETGVCQSQNGVILRHGDSTGKPITKAETECSNS